MRAMEWRRESGLLQSEFGGSVRYWREHTACDTPLYCTTNRVEEHSSHLCITIDCKNLDCLNAYYDASSSIRITGYLCHERLLVVVLLFHL